MFGVERWFVLLLVVLFNLLFWGGLAVLVVWAVRRLGRWGPDDSAMTILNERFAQGLIDQREYETRKAAIKNR